MTGKSVPSGGFRLKRAVAVACVAGLVSVFAVVGLAVGERRLGMQRAGADVASPYRGAGVYVSSGAGSWHGLYNGIPGIPIGHAASCVTPGGGEPDSFKHNGVYGLTGSRSSNGRSLTIAQLAWAYKVYGLDGNNDDGQALDALNIENILGGATVITSSAQAARTRIVAAARAYKGIVPTITGLATSPTGRFNATYTATVHGDVKTTYSLSSVGANLSTKSVTTSASGTATFKYLVPGTNKTGNFTITVAGTVFSRMDEYAAVDQPASQSQTVVTWGSGPGSSTARGSVEPHISASITKLTAGDATKTPRAATFRILDKTTGQTVTTSFTTLAGRPTPLAQGFTPCHTFVFAETKAPAGAYIPSPGTFTVTVPCTATDGFAIVLTDPRIPVITISTTANYQQTPYNTRLVDKVTLTGDDGEAGTITGSLKRLAGVRCSAATAAQWAAAAVVGSYSTPIVGSFGDHKGNGTYTITGPVPTASQTGAWGWFETAKLTPSGASASSPYGAPRECTDVTHPAADTVASEPVGLVGDELHDTITVSGVGQVPAGTGPVGVITSELYYMPYDSDTMQCPAAGTDAGQQAWATYIQSTPAALLEHQNIDVSADTTVMTTPHTIGHLGKLIEGGCYTYATSYTPTGIQTPLVLGAAGAAGESTSIVAPTVHTVLSASTTAKSGSVTFTDNAVITGTHGVPTTLVDQLIGPAEPDAAHSCTTASYQPDAVAGRFADVTVTQDQTVTTNQLVIAKQTTAGCYIAWESLTIPGPGGTNRVAYTAPLGSETAEMALISPTPAPPAPPTPTPPAPPGRAHSGGSVAESGGKVNTGQPGPGQHGPRWAVPAGGVLLTAAGLLLWAYRRRRAPQHP